MKSVDNFLVVAMIIVVLAIVLLGAFLAASMTRGRVTPGSNNLDDHPRYGPKRRAGMAAGEINQKNRNEAAEIEIVNAHMQSTPRRWYRKAANGSDFHQKLIDKKESQIQWDLRIFRNQISKGHPASPRVHPVTGENTGGIRRVPYKRTPFVPKATKKR